ncbi:MAG: cytochrome b [Rhodospirillales bacterium]|nr:cytochrome b [Rhodospirillales bacterium]
MSTKPVHFSIIQRTLHWVMAVMVIAMLFIGITMVSTVGPVFVTLVDVHKPLGIAILVLVLVRLIVRWRLGVPPLPANVLPVQVAVVHLSHWLLYALLLVMPLIGWGMLSAGGYPIALWGPIHLPQILPHNDMLYAYLRRGHTLLAYLFFAVILLHIVAALFHGLILRDGVLERMASVRTGRGHTR